jgi:ADP-heptose:LPS heptosyltransferase
MIRSACRFFKGSVPCAFNKADGSECPTCTHISEVGTRVLIIKLDALGDVLRTGSLVPAIRALHEAPFVVWVTRPDAVELAGMIRGVDSVIALTLDGLAELQAGEWDAVYSLSNDIISASLASIASPGRPPVGFSVHRGALQASNDAAARWLAMASFDRLKRQNTDSYQRIMLDIIGHDGPVLPPVLNLSEDSTAAAGRLVASMFQNSERARVAISIGSGDRWPKKMLDAAQISRYVHALRARLDVDILLVGGPDERHKADSILARCAAAAGVVRISTPSSVRDFIDILQHVDTMLCADSLAVHVASAIGLPTVCVFGPTSIAEIPDFDGLIAKTSAAQLTCLGCYGDCAKEMNCMSMLDIEVLVDLTGAQLSRARPRPAVPAR